jgi:hypothetical protein
MRAILRQIGTALLRFWEWIRHWLWEVPVAEPPKEKPIRVMGEQVFDEYVVIRYHDQLINIQKNEIPLWNKLNREDRRAMARKTKMQVKEGKIRFERINGKLICIKNKDYNSK